MAKLKVHKVVANLPATLEADSLYIVRVGAGFEMYATNGSGTIFAYTSNYAKSDDSRLTDAREWAADTVSQPEAEAGTATTRRAWTAQRVRQAILGWWNGATSAFGRGLVAAADAAAGRTALGLGTAAVANVTTSQTDTTAGRVLRVGDFGVGSSSELNTPLAPLDINTLVQPGRYAGPGSAGVNYPGAFGENTRFGHIDVIGKRNSNHISQIAMYDGLGVNELHKRGSTNNGATWTPWREFYHTGNLTPNVLSTFTLATLPSAAANPRLQVYCSNLTGQPAPVFSDGTNWRRVSDNTIAN